MSFFNFNFGGNKSTMNKASFGNKIVKSPSTPFCTSPSQLQEVTMDPDATFSSMIGLRSPGGPMRGRTVKEFEEEMSNLKKENFNLKLRIYFLEEKLGTHFTLDDDNIVKKNIELQIEVSSLQKEVREKHELLCQAVKAIELEEEEHKKYSQSKEDELAQMQQELEDLRIQIHSHVRSISDQERVQVVYEHNQLLEEKIVQLQKDNQSKDEVIDQINKDLESANERLVEYSQQVRDYEEKLCHSHQAKQNLVLQLQDNKKQMEELKHKYASTKYELENDLEKMRKEGEKTKMMKDMRISMLENECEKHKMRIRDLQSKLEAASAEAKKNHNLAVPIRGAGAKTARNSNTDSDFFVASHAATPNGAQEKGALQLPLDSRTPESKPSSRLAPPTPDGHSLASFENLILHSTGDAPKLLNEFQQVKEEVVAYKKKIVKLKSEQLKACEIIKNMLEMRDKSSKEMEKVKKEKQTLDKERQKLKEENQKLVSELENMVTKPDGRVIPLIRRMAELNIEAGDHAGTPPCEPPLSLSLDPQTQTEDNMDVADTYRALAIELESKIEVLEATLHEKDHQLAVIKDQYDQILTMLEEKENRVVDLEFELLSNQQSGRSGSFLEKGDYSMSEKHAGAYKQEIEEKNREIDRLNVELKKCTCHLQSIVNKELWDKNRQIEKMHTKSQEHTPELLKLKKSLSAKELQLHALKEKISELGLDLSLPADLSFESQDVTPKRNFEGIKALQEHLKAAKQEKLFLENKVSELKKRTEIVDRLENEQKDLLTQLEHSERLRLETNEICTALGTRLEELAIFLDSLLQQKSVLGFLGSAKNKKLRELISNSLDMSRTLSMSLIENPEQSLAQLSNITALLNGSILQDLTCEVQDVEVNETNLSIVPSNITLTYESHLSYKKVNPTQPTQPEQPNNEQVIAALREQVFNLKSELKVRDNELIELQEKLDAECGVKKLTDSEEDKKSDENWKLFTPRNKSLTPKSHSLTLTPKSNTSTITLRNKEKGELQSESDAWSEPDRAVSRARIGLNTSLTPPTSRSTRLVYNESTEDDETGIGISPAKKRLSLMEMHQEILRLENELDQKIEENCAEKQMYLEKLQEMEQDIKSMKQSRIAAQNEKEQAENEVLKLQKTVEELSTIKAQYEASAEGKTKELLNKLNEIEHEKGELLKRCLDFEKQAANAQNEVVSAQEKLNAMEDKMNRAEAEVRKHFEESLISKLQNAEEVFTNKIRQVEEMYEKELNKAKESVKHMQEECRRDYVKKSEVEKKLTQFEHLITELNDLKTTVQSYEETITAYKDKLQEMNNNIQDSEETIRAYKEKHQEFNNIVQDYEEKTKALRRDLDNTTLQYSEVLMEKTKLCNEKVFLEEKLAKADSKETELENKITEMLLNQNEQISKLQSQKSALELKISELESRNAELRNKLVKLQVEKCSLNRSLPIVTGNCLTYQRQCSDRTNYSSEENGEDMPACFGNSLNANLNVRPTRADAERHVANSSPDLGIESDHGRFSSLETQRTGNGNVDVRSIERTVPRPLLETVQLTECMSSLFDEQNNQVEVAVDMGDHCCQKSQDIIQENNELKRKLLRMKRALEETTTQLTLANQRKKQVEKTICKQIHKTSQVLRKAKANLDSGSEM